MTEKKAREREFQALDRDNSEDDPDDVEWVSTFELQEVCKDLTLKHTRSSSKSSLLSRANNESMFYKPIMDNDGRHPGKCGSGGKTHVGTWENVACRPKVKMADVFPKAWNQRAETLPLELKRSRVQNAETRCTEPENIQEVQQKHVSHVHVRSCRLQNKSINKSCCVFWCSDFCSLERSHTCLSALCRAPVWLQCEECLKWRSVPADHYDVVPESWNCSQNPNPRYRCAERKEKESCWTSVSI